MKLILSNDQSKYLETQTELVKLNIKERLKYSFQKFSFFFLMAVGSIFIPVLHFVLVPLFLLLSIIIGLKSYSIRYRLNLGDTYNCVHCSKKLKSIYLLDNDLNLKCENCFNHYIIELS